MKNVLLVGLCLTLFLACKQTAKPVETATQPTPTLPIDTTATTAAPTTLNNFDIVLGKSVGKVAATATYTDLIKLFGATNLKTDTISEAEGTEESVATFVKAESAEEIIVIWHDDAVKKRIDRIQIYAENSPYKTTEGVKIGTNLAELEKINGKPVTFYGFGWDYGGVVSNWNKGVFEGRKLLTTLDFIEPNVRYDVSKMPLMGDSEFKSTDTKVKAWREKIKVRLIEVQF